jgi:hypothetical protein
LAAFSKKGVAEGAMPESNTNPPIPAEMEELYETVCSRIEEDNASASARFSEALLLDPNKLQPLTFRYISELFDISAYYNHFLVWDRTRLKSFYEPYVQANLEIRLSHADKMTSHWPPNQVPQRFLRHVKAYLLGRSQHWKAEGLKRARQMERTEKERGGLTVGPPLVTTWEDIEIWFVGDMMWRFTLAP